MMSKLSISRSEQSPKPLKVSPSEEDRSSTMGLAVAVTMPPFGGPVPRKGFSYLMAAFFLTGQMAGGGFLALPRALANTGWLGVPMMIIFCVAVGLSGVRLGSCWVILEERWPELYLNNVRQPYMDIAERAMGKHGRRLALATVIITLLGATTVFLILIAEFIQPLVPALSTCNWVLVNGAVLMPFTWLGTPKDFWQAPVMAVFATIITCIVIFIEIFVSKVDNPYVDFPNPTISSFSLGFGAILFSFGGASIFPTIQNDMKDRSEFWKSVVITFATLLILYLPVAAAGYGMLGTAVTSNILLSIKFTTVITCAIVLEIVNLLGTYVIGLNPIGQAFEDILNIPGEFGWKRIVVRSSIVIFEVLIGLAIPDFGLILNLIGGSTVTLCSFVLPPIMYMLLVDNCENPNWPKRTIPLWERIALWEIITVGVIGGITSTVSALIVILSPDSFGSSCFTANDAADL